MQALAYNTGLRILKHVLFMLRAFYVSIASEIFRSRQTNESKCNEKFQPGWR